MDDRYGDKFIELNGNKLVGFGDFWKNFYEKYSNLTKHSNHENVAKIAWILSKANDEYSLTKLKDLEKIKKNFSLDRIDPRLLSDNIEDAVINVQQAVSSLQLKINNRARRLIEEEKMKKRREVILANTKVFKVKMSDKLQRVLKNNLLLTFDSMHEFVSKRTWERRLIKLTGIGMKTVDEFKIVFKDFIDKFQPIHLTANISPNLRDVLEDMQIKCLYDAARFIRMRDWRMRFLGCPLADTIHCLEFDKKIVSIITPEISDDDW